MSSKDILDIMSALIFISSGVSFMPSGRPLALAIASSCSGGIELTVSITCFMASGSWDIISCILESWSGPGRAPGTREEPSASPVSLRADRAVAAVSHMRSMSASSMLSSMLYWLRICSTLIPGGAPFISAILRSSSSVMFFIMLIIIFRIPGSFMRAAACEGSGAADAAAQGASCPPATDAGASSAEASSGTSLPSAASLASSSLSWSLIVRSPGEAAAALRRSSTPCSRLPAATRAMPRL
mmetsp:Transcript_33705/g.79999  ORF Transcript_33705/g.79999 Transcript_33705/m.79999 type:complete len:242 (+) Transcript_33705:1007-1732(+)